MWQKAYGIDAKIVRAALAHWRELEQTGPESFRRAAARQAALCELLLASVEGEEASEPTKRDVRASDVLVRLSPRRL